VIRHASAPPRPGPVVDLRTRLAARFLDPDGILELSRTEAWAWFQLPTVPYEFLTEEERDQLAISVMLGMAGIRDTDCHLLVVHRDYPTHQWVGDLHANVRQPAPGWRAYLGDQQHRVRTHAFWHKEVWFGVRLGKRRNGRILDSLPDWALELIHRGEDLVGLDDDVVSPAELADWRDRAHAVARSLAQGPLHARPATSNDLAWLIQQTCHRSLPPPPPAASPIRTWGPGELTRLVQGRIENGYHYLTLVQPTGIAHVAFLAISRFPDTMRYPHVEPWIYYAEKLDYPVEFSVRMHLASPQQAVKDTERQRARAKDQADHMQEANVTPGLRLQRQLAIAEQLSDDLVEQGIPFAYTRSRLAVSANDPETLEARAAGVIDHYRQLGIEVEWPTADQFPLFLEAMPGDRVQLRAYLQYQPLLTVAGGLPTASAELGEPVGKDPERRAGPYIGKTSSRSRLPVHFDPLTASRLNEPAALGIIGSLGGGKALALDTPIPTPAGWTTMGALKVGDQVFDEQGQPTTVAFATDIMQGHDCYEVVFSDGTVIVADDDHRWRTWTRAARRAAQRAQAKRTLGSGPDRSRNRVHPSVVTTTGIRDTLRVHASRHANHAVEVAGPLEYPGSALPVDPYVLGVWLARGAGGVGASIATTDPEILAAVELAGYPLTRHGPSTYRVAAALQGALGDLGVLDDAHLPVRYLRGSVQQRRSLLAGLLDAGGTATKTGRCEFGTGGRRLAEDVLELVIGLGDQPTLTSRPARGGGCGTAYRVSFTPHDKVFRLPRKLTRQRPGNVPATQRFRYIVGVRPVPSVPVRCIAVDSPSHLFLASRACIPTHNTNLALLLTYQAVLRGAAAFYIDPKGDARGLARLLAHHTEQHPNGQAPSRVLDLASGQPGLLDPFSLSSDPAARKLLALDMLFLLLPPDLSEDRRTAVYDAVAAVLREEAEHDQPASLERLVGWLERQGQRGNAAARGLAIELGVIAELPFAQLLFAAGDGSLRQAPPGLTVITLAGLTFPDPATPREHYSVDERLGVAVFHAVAKKARQLLHDLGHQWRLLVLDEAWMLTSTPQGRKLIQEAARMGRSRGMPTILVSQLARDFMGQEITNCLSAVFAFRSTAKGEVVDVLELLRVENSAEHQAEIRGLDNGECVFLDLDSRAGKMRVDLGPEELQRALDTNPERARLAVAAGGEDLTHLRLLGDGD
jgi:AAA-like domain